MSTGEGDERDRTGATRAQRGNDPLAMKRSTVSGRGKTEVGREFRPSEAWAIGAIGDIGACARSACTANQPLENLDQIHCSHCRHAAETAQHRDSTAQRRKPALNLSNITLSIFLSFIFILGCVFDGYFFPMGSMYLLGSGFEVDIRPNKV